MPEVSGFELCRQIQADPETKAIPIVIFSGSNETIDIISGISAGAFEYITKPIDGAALIAKVRANQAADEAGERERQTKRRAELKAKRASPTPPKRAQPYRRAAAH